MASNGEICTTKAQMKERKLRIYEQFNILKEQNHVYKVDWQNFDEALLKLGKVKALIEKIANEKPYRSVPVRAIHNLYYEKFKESFLNVYTIMDDISKKLTKGSSPWDIDKIWNISQGFFTGCDVSYYSEIIDDFICEILNLNHIQEWERKHDIIHDRIRTASCNADSINKQYGPLLKRINADNELIYKINEIINPNPPTDRPLGSISDGMKENLSLDILNGVFARIERYFIEISNVESLLSKRKLLFELNDLLCKTKNI